MSCNFPIWYHRSAVAGHGGRNLPGRGITLIELLLVLIIIGVLALLAVPSYSSYMDRQKIAQAETDIAAIGVLVAQYENDNQAYPMSLADIGMDQRLDPWGRPYQYLNLQAAGNKGHARKDHNLVPINTDFDLYSMGKDGLSVAPLTARQSQDDIIRANNGSFVGLASDYSG